MPTRETGQQPPARHPADHPADPKSDPTIDPHAIIDELYEPGSELHVMLVEHSRRVAEKALAIADFLSPSAELDRNFLEEAALLHDIGIYRTRAPKLCCHGDHPYLMHGVLGRKILEARRLPRHALVCERHVGVGITADEIRRKQLPLPERDMIPLTLEEEIVAYADKFYSKDCKTVYRENTLTQILDGMRNHGPENIEIFRGWAERFEPGLKIP
jgi:uncharacterized protein